MAQARTPWREGMAAEIVDAGWDTPPRWLRYCGLPQVLGQSAMDVYELLVRAALSQTAMCRVPTRDDGQIYPPGTVAYTRAALAQATGTSDSTIRRALAVVERHNLVEIIKRGHRAPYGEPEPSWVTVDLGMLPRVYALSCGEIPDWLGGLRPVGRQRNILVRVHRDATPIQISRGLVSPRGWTGPPVPLIEAALLRPSSYPTLLEQRGRIVELERQLLAALDGQRPISATNVEWEVGQFAWVPPEVEKLVEKLLGGLKHPGQNDGDVG